MLQVNKSYWMFLGFILKLQQKEGTLKISYDKTITI